MADVRADRSGAALAQATKEPDKTLLPARDESGREFVATFEQVASRKGIAGAFSRLVEPESRRSLRGQLTETKVAYLGHLRADAEGREAFRDAARQIVRECRERSREFGYYAPAAPELSPGKIQEVRDHAAKQTGARGEGWLADCAQSQKLKDERELAAVAATRAARTVEISLPGAPTGEGREELIRREIEAPASAYQWRSDSGRQRRSRTTTDRADLTIRERAGRRPTGVGAAISADNTRNAVGITGVGDYAARPRSNPHARIYFVKAVAALLLLLLTSTACLRAAGAVP